ncbi:hypothetical protein BCR43DRAFT_250027 [Syncephalastrum racemosum]|uniref:Uncharacterized protein n=1 Tax=Syncephalastrum racemosum TaxID=13706 RepID=A0A1X2HFN9_SYNRA|nr:hypothetical protein BCR43DRAFT_250027 [Syncephalastrum racemosum]
MTYPLCPGPSFLFSSLLIFPIYLNTRPFTERQSQDLSWKRSADSAPTAMIYSYRIAAAKMRAVYQHAKCGQFRGDLGLATESAKIKGDTRRSKYPYGVTVRHYAQQKERIVNNVVNS